MATTERPPVKIDGKRNPAYDEWYRAQRKAAAVSEREDLTELANSLGENHEGGPRRASWPTEKILPPEDSIAETLSLRVMGFLPNRSFVECDNNGHRLTVKVDPRYRDRLLKKTINVRREEDGTYSQVQ